MNEFVPAINRAAEAWSDYIWHASWQAAVVGLAILAIVLVGRRWSSPLRYGLLLVALIKFATPPFLALPTGLLDPLKQELAAMSEVDNTVGPAVPAGMDRRTAHTGDATSPPRVETPPAEQGTGDLQAVPPPTISPHVASSVRSAPGAGSARRAADATARPDPASRESLHRTACLLLLWLCGAGIAATWVMGQAVRLARLGHNSRPLRDETVHRRFHELARRVGLRRPPHLTESAEIGVPISCGLLRRRVILPSGLGEQLTGGQLDQILAHELVHHRRHDLAANLLQGAMFVLWWFHPVYWLVSRSLRTVREECCDDLLLARGITHPAEYCATLVAVARLQARGRVPQLATTMSCTGRRLAARLVRITDETLPRRAALPLYGILSVLIAALVLLPGLQGEQPAAPPTTTTDAAAADEKGEPPDDARRAVRIFTGHVQDPDGKPVAAARVILTQENTFAQRLDERVRIVARGTTGDDGRFRLDVPRAELEHPLNRGFSVWLYRPGYAVHVSSYHASKHYEPLDVTLEPEDASFTIVEHDGRPLAGAAVAIRGVKSPTSYEDVPAELQQLLERKTDARGHVTLPVAAREEIVNLAVELPGRNPQYFGFYGSERRSPETLPLLPVGAVSLQLTCDEPRAAAGVEVQVSTGPVDPGEDEAYRRGSIAVVRTDESGRVTIPGVAPGKLLLMVFENEAFPYRAVPPRDLLIAAAQTTHVDVPLQRAVRITGRVLERGTERPIPSVVVSVNQRRHGRYERGYETNERGEYSLLLLPGSALVRFWAPVSHVRPPEFHPVEVPSGDAHELPDLHLKPGYTLTGTTLGPNGEPVEQVFVRAVYRTEFDRSTDWKAYNSDSQVFGYSGPGGNFALDRVPADTSVRLLFAREGAEVAGPIFLEGQPSEPLVVRVRDLDLVTLSGTVVDPQGRPVPNVPYRIQERRVVSPSGGYAGPIHRGTADATGRIQVAKKLPRQGMYQLQIMSDEAVVAESDWLRPEAANTTEFEPMIYRGPPVAAEADARQRPPNEVLEKGVLTGLLVDSAGKPVAGADVLVWSMARRMRTKSAADGSFSFPDFPLAGAWLFADAAEFRFHGQWAEPEAFPLKVTLTKKTEPAEPMHALDEPPLDEALQQQAWKAFEPIGMDVLLRTQQGRAQRFNLSEYDEVDVLKLMARYDPDAAIDHLQGRDADAESLKYYTVLPAAKADLKHALAIVDGIEAADRRASILSGLALQPAATRDGMAAELLARAEEAASLDGGTTQALRLTVIASAHRKNGNLDRARALLADVESRLLPLDGDGWSQYVTMLFAYERALVDGVDTSGILGPFEDERARTRAYGNLAHALAGTNPARAEELLQKTSGSNEWFPRVCRAMAATDLPRARRIADSIADPVGRAYSLGMIAAAIAEQDRDGALALVEEAYALLAETAETDARTSRSLLTPVNTAVALWPVVEQIDPTLVREYFWRALSLRGRFTFGSRSWYLGEHGRAGEPMRLSDPVLAACAARYDLEVARRLLRPPGDESLAPGATEYPYYYFFTAAILDPAGTLQIVASLPGDSRSQRVAQHQAWRELFASFQHRGHDRWEYLMDGQLHQWAPGEFDP